MKYIQKEKSRKLTFKERKNGLARKLNQFVSKTGAKACLIVYDNDGNNVGPMSWPEDPTIVNSMLQEYEHKKIEEAPEIFDVHKYYEIKKNKIEAKITNVRKDTLKKKYPTWHPHFQNMEENQLRDFIATVNDRIQACDHKISMLKNMQHSETSFLQNNALVQNMVQESVVSSHSSQVNAIHNIPQMQQHINGTSDLPQNSSTNQLHDISEMIDFTNLGDLPPSTSTKQLSQLGDFDDSLNQLDGGVLNQASQPDQFFWKDLSFSSQSEKGNASYLIDLHPSSSTKQLSRPNDFGYWLNDGDLNWASQPNQFAWKDLSFSSQGEESNASYLDDFPPSSSTKQLSQPRAFDDRLKQLDDGVGQFASKDLSFSSQSEEGNPNYLIDLHPSSSTKQLSQPNDFGYLLNDGDLNWASQPNQFAWKDLSFSSQSEEGNASYLGDFPPSSSTKQLSQPRAFDDRLKQLDDGVGQFASKDLSFPSQSEEGNANSDDLIQWKDKF